MKKATRIIIGCFISLLVVTLGFLVYRSTTVSGKYKENLEYSYKSSLGTLSEELRNLTRTLEKSLFASTVTGRQKVCDSINSCSEAAKAAASALPFSAGNADRIENLLSKCGDFALYLSRKNARGEGFSETDLDSLKSLGEYTAKLSETVIKLRDELGAAGTDIGKTETLLQNTAQIDSPENFNIDSFSEEMEGFPEMIYDGPFSDSVQKSESKLLKGESEISRDEAISIAAEFTGEEASSLRYDSTSSRGTEVFRIKGDNISVDVSKRGGRVVWMKRSGDTEESKMNYEDALSKALETLDKAGIPFMTETGYVISDNNCTISFVPRENDILLYPDLVKLSIELNEGGTIEYDASGYIMNHGEREELRPEISEEEALAVLSPALKPEKSGLALIPAGGSSEILCWELQCSAEKDKYAVYINASTGLEEEIFQIIETDSSRMTS